MAEKTEKWFRFNAIGFPTGSSVGASINVLAPTVRELRRALARRMVDTGFNNFGAGSIDRVEVSFKGNRITETAILERKVLHVEWFTVEVKLTEYYKELMLVKR